MTQHGFETPFGMELLATVHWVCAREGAKTAEEAIELTYAWNERKRAFDRMCNVWVSGTRMRSAIV